MNQTNAQMNDTIKTIGTKAIFMLFTVVYALTGWTLVRVEHQDVIESNVETLQRDMENSEVRFRADLDESKRLRRELDKKVDDLILIAGANTTNYAAIKEDVSDIKSILREDRERGR